ncbi:hypothetical protein AAIB41_11585 [Brucella sp. BE17]|uniref:hypothetical protein n=1 Tax=Brucella sp. BE17 TaxID=3142977 RepID=UPI0031B9FDF9
MIGHLHLRVAQIVMVGSTLLISGLGLAQDDTTRVLSTKLRAVEVVVGNGENLKSTVT